MNPYISEIIIENFEAHRYTHLHLSPGVNMFIGDSDVGKSAVLKALRWLFTNQPAGDEFRSWWGGGTKVHACVAPQNIWAGRVKEQGRNYYYIGEDTVENRLEGFGKGPPPRQIQDFFNIGEVNIQGQMTLPFLLSQTTGKAGRFFNEAADVGIIDIAVTNINSVLTRERAELETAKQSKKDTKAKLVNFDWLPEADKCLAELEEIDSQVTNYADRIIKLDGLAEDAYQIQQDIETIQPILSARQEVERLIEIDSQIDGVNKRYAVLLIWFREVNETETRTEQIQAVLRAQGELEQWAELNEQITAMDYRMDALEEEVGACRLLEKSIKEDRAELGQLEAQFHDLMPDECPLCGAVG